MEWNLAFIETIFILIIIILDSIAKLFYYLWFIIIPLSITIILLFIKKYKIKNNLMDEEIKRRKTKKLKIIISVLSVILINIIAFSPFFGYKIYKYIMFFSIGNKENVIEKKLENKYGKNFTFISKSKIYDREPGIGEFDLSSNYEVDYYFKDDDGVLAEVTYHKKYAYDYYKAERSDYEIEQKIYNYAKQNNFNEKFYVLVNTNSYDNEDDLNKKSDNNYIQNKVYSFDIQFILTKKSNKNIEFIESALNNITNYEKMIDIEEYIVSKNNYQRIISFYESPQRIYDNFDYNKINIIYHTHYYLKCN